MRRNKSEKDFKVKSQKGDGGEMDTIKYKIGYNTGYL